MCACSNLPPLLALPATRMAMLNANGVLVRVSSLSVIICSVKFLPETLLVLYVPERVQLNVAIVKGLDFVLSG